MLNLQKAIFLDRDGLINDNSIAYYIYRIEDFKLKLIQYSNPKNSRMIQPDGKVDYFEIINKGVGISDELLVQAGFKELNQEFDDFEDKIKTQNLDDNSKRLIEEINDYRLPKYKDAEPIISQLSLITLLNVLNDWQNKLLLISYMQASKSI